MHRLIRTALASLALVLLASSSGCALGSFSVLLVDFESTSIDGVRLWRLQNGTWRPDLAIEFNGVVRHKGEEYLSYGFGETNSQIEVEMIAPIERDGAAAELRFVFVPLEEGRYKFTAFNDAGDSGLSKGTYSL